MTQDGTKINNHIVVNKDGYIVYRGVPEVENPNTSHWERVNDDGSLFCCVKCGELCCCRGKYCMNCGRRMVDVEGET